jgi:hypothetical protein
MSRVERPEYAVDTPFCDRMVQPFAQAFKGGKGKEPSFNGGRFDPRLYASRSTDGIFKRKQASADGIPTITTIIDCSGSMSGSPISNAIQLAAVMSRLHARKLVHANILLTGFSSHPSARTNGFKVPVPQPDWVWGHLNARHGAEGISQCFKTFMEDVKKSALVTCFTDADISDKALNPSLWRKHGVQCIGLYVGNLRQLKVLDRYFDRSIVRTNLSDLFTSYLNMVRHMINRNKH